MEFDGRIISGLYLSSYIVMRMRQATHTRYHVPVCVCIHITLQRKACGELTKTTELRGSIIVSIPMEKRIRVGIGQTKLGAPKVSIVNRDC